MSENDIKYVNHCTQNRTQLWVAMAQGLLACDFCPPGLWPLWTRLGCPFTATTPWAPVVTELTGLCVGRICLPTGLARRTLCIFP